MLSTEWRTEKRGKTAPGASHDAGLESSWIHRRSFTLSRELDPGKIEAKLASGVLRLRIPKGEEAKPRGIDVSAN